MTGQPHQTGRNEELGRTAASTLHMVARLTQPTRWAEQLMGRSEPLTGAFGTQLISRFAAFGQVGALAASLANRFVAHESAAASGELPLAQRRMLQRDVGMARWSGGTSATLDDMAGPVSFAPPAAAAPDPLASDLLASGWASPVAAPAAPLRRTSALPAPPAARVTAPLPPSSLQPTPPTEQPPPHAPTPTALHFQVDAVAADAQMEASVGPGPDEEAAPGAVAPPAPDSPPRPAVAPEQSATALMPTPQPAATSSFPTQRTATLFRSAAAAQRFAPDTPLPLVRPRAAPQPAAHTAFVPTLRLAGQRPMALLRSSGPPPLQRMGLALPEPTGSLESPGALPDASHLAPAPPPLQRMNTPGAALPMQAIQAASRLPVVVPSPGERATNQTLATAPQPALDQMRQDAPSLPAPEPPAPDTAVVSDVEANSVAAPATGAVMGSTTTPSSTPGAAEHDRPPLQRDSAPVVASRHTSPLLLTTLLLQRHYGSAQTGAALVLLRTNMPATQTFGQRAEVGLPPDLSALSRPTGGLTAAVDRSPAPLGVDRSPAPLGADLPAVRPAATRWTGGSVVSQADARPTLEIAAPRSAVVAPVAEPAVPFSGLMLRAADNAADWQATPVATTQPQATSSQWHALPLVQRVLQAEGTAGRVLGTQPLAQRALTHELLRLSVAPIGGQDVSAATPAAPNTQTAMVDATPPALQREPEQGTTTPLPWMHNALAEPVPPVGGQPLALAPPFARARGPAPAAAGQMAVPAAAIWRSSAPLDLVQQPRAMLQRAETEASAVPSQPTESAPPGGAAQPDIETLARQVYDHLRRRLLIDHERRGRGV